MRVVGLTGGVACGKSTVARALEFSGIPVLDADAIGHELLSEDPGVAGRVRKIFGTSDRPALRRMIFTSPSKRRKLEELLHSRIGWQVAARLDDLRRSVSAPAAAVVMAPLLFEAGWDRMMDEVIAVVSSPEHQLQRLRDRDGVDEVLARGMIASQMPNEEKARRATHVLWNDGTRAELARAARALAAKLKTSSGERARRTPSPARPGVRSSRKSSRAGRPAKGN